MDTQIFENTIASIQQKLGETEAGKIADDLGVLKTAQADALKTQQERDNLIASLERDREDLQKANSRLLNQIPMGEELDKPSLQEVADHPLFDPSKYFDDNGNLKKG